MRTFVLVGVVMASAVLAGCSGGPNAHELAQQACDLARPNNTPTEASDGDISGDTISDLQAAVDDYQEAASLAAKAAAADRSYERLAEAINNMEGIWSAVVGFYEKGGMDPNTWTADQLNRAKEVIAGWDAAESTAYAQCEIVAVE